MNELDGPSVKGIHDILMASRPKEADLFDLERELRERYERLYADPLDILHAGPTPPISPEDWQALRDKVKALDLHVMITRTRPNPPTQPSGT